MPLTTEQAAADARPDAGAAAIRVDQLEHRYRARRGAEPVNALAGVSFTARPGEVFGILGPNGSGKSTLFGILSTLLQPRGSGSASIFGHDVVAEPAAARQQIGVVFQHPSLDAKLTAAENLRHQGRLYGLGGRALRERIDHWLDRFGLADRRNEYVERFSGGMRRRVELAKALLHEPKLLLMDEPATGLDPAARREMWHHLLVLREQQGVTVAVTTHLMDEAERCDRLAIMDRGRLVALDTPGTLKASIGGEVVRVEPDETQPNNEPETLARLIEEQLGPWGEGARPRVVEGEVRFEHPDGPAVVARVASTWPGRVQRISVGQPTLEDVFLDLTGGKL
ncbi:MAG: ABC transporter ATP-binding protein [Phycisphaeraceae bacterium]